MSSGIEPEGHAVAAANLGHGHRAGLFASTACAIHCALTPFAVSLFPLMGLQNLLDVRVEWTLVGLAIALNGITIVPAYRRHHHRVSPLVLFAVGAVLMVAARIVVPHGDPLELPISVVGAACLISAQLLNARFRHTCPCDHNTHAH